MEYCCSRSHPIQRRVEKREGTFWEGRYCPSFRIFDGALDEDGTVDEVGAIDEDGQAFINHRPNSHY